MLGSCGWLHFLQFLEEKIEKRQGLLNLFYMKAQCTGLSTTAVFHLSAQAFSLQSTELSNVPATLETGGFTGQVLRYSRSNHLYDMDGEKKKCKSEGVPDVC